jgi:hypothetical protein
VRYDVNMDALLRGHGITRFTARELCPVGRTWGGVTLKAPPCVLWANIIPTVRVAQQAREHFGRPMIVNSGYRDPDYNRAVGSSPGSQHVRFTAMDVRIAGVTPRGLYDWFVQHPEAGRMGIGLYPTFVHIDKRGAAARW